MARAVRGSIAHWPALDVPHPSDGGQRRDDLQRCGYLAPLSEVHLACVSLGKLPSGDCHCTSAFKGFDCHRPGTCLLSQNARPCVAVYRVGV
jgi:hypothetical protein